MENKSNPQSQPSLGIFGILRESFKTTKRNAKLLVPILLLVFLSLSQLDFAENYILEPVSEDFSLQLAKHPNMLQDFSYNIHQTAYGGALNDIRELLLVDLLILALSCIISLVFLVATVSSSSEAYTAKVLGPKDVFLKIKKSWKKTLLTSFYMILITSGLFCLSIISFAIIFILAVNSWAYFFYGVTSFSVAVFSFYMAALWMLSVVVSVLEDGIGGFKAIGRAADLMKGKRVQASLIMVPFAIGHGIVYMTANALTSYNLSLCTRLALTISFSNGFNCLLTLFLFVVYTVFYHERKTCHDEKEVKGLYVPIAAGEV